MASFEFLYIEDLLVTKSPWCINRSINLLLRPLYYASQSLPALTSHQRPLVETATSVNPLGSDSPVALAARANVIARKSASGWIGPFIRPSALLPIMFQVSRLRGQARRACLQVDFEWSDLWTWLPPAFDRLSHPVPSDPFQDLWLKDCMTIPKDHVKEEKRWNAVNNMTKLEFMIATRTLLHCIVQGSLRRKIINWKIRDKHRYGVINYPWFGL